eukprot:m.228890 g.228890  ORF g.228890 m.228890 type:complete len:397 (-) comp25989_c0_seq3:858-2048(-)
MLPLYHASSSSSPSPARPSLEGPSWEHRRGSPLRPRMSPLRPRTPRSNPPSSKGTAWAGGAAKVSPVRKARRHLEYPPRRETLGCSALESMLCITGVLCILVFLVLYDFDHAWHDAPRSRQQANANTGPEALQPMVAKLPWRGSNISAYPDDPYTQHWEGKRCEQQTSGGRGRLPSLLVMGVHKGGSTALFQYLSAHGSIRPSFCKEAHFFDWKWNVLKNDLGLGPHDQPTEEQLETMREAYRRFFRAQEPDQPPFLSIEGTPNYFHTPDVPPRVKQMLPDTQLVVAMRNPVDRAISHFMGQKAREFKRFRSCGTWFNEYVARSPMPTASGVHSIRFAAHNLRAPGCVPCHAVPVGDVRHATVYDHAWTSNKYRTARAHTEPSTRLCHVSLVGTPS